VIVGDARRGGQVQLLPVAGVPVVHEEIQTHGLGDREEQPLDQHLGVLTKSSTRGQLL